MSVLLEAHSLSIAFQSLKALTNFSLAIPEGEIHGIIGPNGAGKTTAINALTGFLQPTSGGASFAGKPLPHQSHEIAATGIGRTFQSPSIFTTLSAVQNVMCGGHRWTKGGLFAALFRSSLMREEEKTLRSEAIGWLEKVGFSFSPDIEVSGLPFGELRKLEIARALMGRPRLLMLDEPTAGLTADEVIEVGRLLRSVRTPDGKPLTIILVEHNVPFVFGLCDRVTAVDKGLVIACGTPQEVRETRSVIDSYLGSAATGSAPMAAPAAPRGPTNVETQPLLEVRGLSAGYGRMTVVRDIDLSVRAGDLIVLCGRNGAGKSTILNSIVGQPCPSSGEVTWGGKRIDGMSVSSIVRAGIGLVPQERGVISGQSVNANLLLSTSGLGLSSAEFDQRCGEIYARFPKLLERREQLAGTLSGGERQMLAIAKVLIRRPRLILLDEPTTGLAPTIVDELQKIVVDINAQGIALIVAEQNVDWIASIASRAYLLENGRILSSGDPTEVIRQEQIIESYLGEAVKAPKILAEGKA